MMQMILTAIAEGNLRMGTETMEHNSELKSAMNRVCRLGEELSNTLNDSEKELLENWKIPMQKQPKAIPNRALLMVFVWVHW